jgi:hypothetical protein
VPGYALDTFVLATIKRVLVAEYQSAKQAIDAFVKAVLAPKNALKRSHDDERELELLNRKIKATLAMMADPTFDGLDELRTTLADIKAKRDAVESRLKRASHLPAPMHTEKELRSWATERLAKLEDLLKRRSSELQDRQLVEMFVDHIDVNPETKSGVVYLMADLESALKCSSTRLPIGDFMGNHEWCFYGWKEGAAHVYLGPNNAVDVWSVKKINPNKMVHLTEKPVELAIRAMQYSSRSGENVLDLFGGSGSTMIAAEQTGRKAFLMELDTPYCDVIVERWEKFTGKKAVCEKAVATTEKTPAEARVVGERTPDVVTC